MKEKGSCLEELKKNYLKVQKRYGLPSFDELNREFGIERISEIETDFLIREIRKFIADKISNYLRFIEMILQPTNSPMFVFSIIKTLGREDKNKLTEIYKKLTKFEVRLIELDIDFSENKEADFIKEVSSVWKEIKKDILEVVNSINRNWDNKIERNGGGYFG